jgi:hypothetical protein
MWHNPGGALINIYFPKRRVLAFGFVKYAQMSNNNKLKVLQRDRKTFQRFCKFATVEDVDLIFDSAAAKEVPVDIEELIANAKNIGETAKTRECLQEFVSLVFDGEDVGDLEIRALREKWIKRQESVAGIMMSEDGALDLSAVHNQIREQAMMIEELETQLKDRSRIIVSVEDKYCQTDERVLNTGSMPNKKSTFAQTETLIIEEKKTEPTVDVKALETQVSKLGTKLKSAESELRAVRDAKSVVESKLAAAEKEKNKFSFVEELALKQVGRDAEVAVLQQELEELRTSRPPSPVTQPRDDSELKRNIFVKFVTYAVSNDYDKLKALIPVATELFQLTRQDVEQIGSACTTDSSVFSNWVSSYLRI